MANWIRLICSVLALVGLLAAGTSGAFASKSHHHCCPQMSSAMPMDDHAAGGAGDNQGVLPDCCVMGACAFVRRPHALAGGVRGRTERVRAVRVARD